MLVMFTKSNLKIALEKELSRDGVFFIVWGWLMLYNNLTGYIQREYLLQHIVEKSLNIFGYIFGAFTFILTILYFIQEKKSGLIHKAVLWPVWLTMLGCMVLINLILFNVLQDLNLELQHSLFMVTIAFAVIATGIISKNRIFIYGGILFGILALLASYLPLAQQLILEATGWLFAIIIPGHLMYLKSKKA